ncbi:MAG: prolyl oligopeptidase family serine peptidase, partial [Bacteroidales bacterium]|nr:prolyl oligopeptidase family serine peptidase [Bacteroidales bacterium]
MRRLIAISIVLTLGLAAWGQGVQERCTRHTMKFQGFEREYYLYTPQGLKEKAPLVMVLHGYGGSALKGRKEMMDVADRYGFAVCYPQGEKDPSGKTGWNVGYPKQEGMKTDDVKFICALAKKVCRENGLDSGNTFLTGMSNGGEMCYFTAMRKPKAFKAIASIAGLTMEWIAQEYSYSHPVPFMEVHGTADHTSEWYGDPDNSGGWGAYLPVPVAVAR